MGLFRVKRTEDDEEFGTVETYLTSDDEWGTEDEASFFNSRSRAREAIRSNPFDSTGDYRYDIERADDDED